MITDRIENVYKYTEIPQIVKDFMSNLKSDISNGKIILNDDIYVNVETYTTKSVSDGKFETHKKYADIQILVSGSENIYYCDKSALSTDILYNEEKDIEFYSDDVEAFPHVNIDGTNFVMLLPEEAHAPQVCVNNQQSMVKKVVIKIRM